MTNLAVAQLAAVLLAASTPWFVVRIALGVATASPGAAMPYLHSMKALRAITMAVAIAAAIATLVLAPSPWILLVAGLGFAAPAVVALRALGEIDDLTRPARHVNSAERVASLRPRKPGQYLPWPWRLTAAGAAVFGASAFIIRLSSRVTDRQVLVPVAFASAAMVFLWLYEVWAHQVVTGPLVAEDARDRRRIVRRIFAMELLLVTVCLGAAHALLGLKWAENGTLGAAIALGSGAIGIVGCALALASGLVGRQYVIAGITDHTDLGRGTDHTEQGR